MKLCFPIRTFNAHAYVFAISEKRLHEKKQKTLRTTQNLFKNWGKIKANGKKTVHFLMRSCSIQSLLLHSDNDHMQKSRSCDLWLSTWRWIKFCDDCDDKRKIVMIKEINHLTFGVAVSGKNVNQRKFFQHQLCLFSPGDGHLQKIASCYFYLST